MSETPPAQLIVDGAIELTGFKRSVVEFLYDEYLEEQTEDTFYEYLGRLLGDGAFVIAASKGFSINGCLAAYDYGYQTVNDGINLEDLERVIDDIELEGLPSTEDDA
jgi:hypothetical protein